MIKKLSRQGPTHQGFVIATGYILFSLMVLGLVLGTVVPAAQLLMAPHVRTVNVLVFLISLVVSALLPALIAYAVGGASTRAKSHQVHHYNGVMFAVLAYWVTVVFSQYSFGMINFIHATFSPVIGTALGFMVPVVEVAVVIGILAFYYHRGARKQQGIAAYRPYQLSLLFIALLFFVTFPLQQALGGMSSTYSVIVAMVELGLLALAYICLLPLRIGALHRSTLAVVGATLAIIAQYVVSQFMPGAYTVVDGAQVISLTTMFLVSAMLLALYLNVTRLTYRK